MGGRQGRQWLARALSLALLLQVLIAPSRAEALSWRLPGRGAAPASSPASEHATRHLREVPPPPWVQQARLALEDRDPTVRILSPADGELLPDGPWTLRLQVGDWPLVDGGPLGLGPHLVVQLDGEAPRPTVDTAVVMPPLSPGSHLLTVYAAKPWGEAHKSPLALRQIRIHRLAPNPATLPAPGTPRLIPVSPAGPAGDPPLLVDWLLIDAPLQGLRGDASGWRLRLTVNGESVLLDQQTPLWLQGWRPGSNALLLELLDGRGEPLNPPFNSLLREVIVPAAGPNGSDRGRPAPLTDLELAVLLGDQPVSALAPDTPEEPLSQEVPLSQERPPSQERPVSPNVPTTTAIPPSTDARASAPVSSPPSSEPLSPPALDPDRAPAPPEPPSYPTTPGLAPSPEPQGPPATPSISNSLSASPPLPDPAVDRDNALAPAPASPEPAASATAAAQIPTQITPQIPSEDSASNAAEVNTAEANTATGPGMAARTEVNADGRLKRPSGPTPLERLRERFGR